MKKLTQEKDIVDGLALVNVDRHILEKDLVDGYLPKDTISIPLLGQHTLFVQAPIGTGKTTVFKNAKRIYENSLKRDGKESLQVSIVPSRALAADQSKKLDYPHYISDYKGMPINKSAVVVINSILRVVYDSNNLIDVLFLDEYSKVLKSITHSGDFMTPSLAKDVKEFLNILISSARVVIITDADLTNDQIREVNRLRLNASVRTIVAYKKVERTFLGYKKEGHFRTQVLNAAKKGLRVYVPTVSKTLGNNIKKFLEASIEGIKVIMVSSDTTGSLKMGELNKTVEEYQILIGTPALLTGFDITSIFDVVFGIYMAGSVDVVDFIQQIGRCRNVRSTNYSVYVKPHTKDVDRNMMNEDYIFKNIYNSFGSGPFNTSSIPKGCTYQMNDSGVPTEKKSSLEYAKHYSTNEAFRNRNGVMNPIEAFETHCLSHQYEIIWADESEDTEENKINAEVNKKSKAEAKKKQIEKICSTTIVTSSEVRKLKKKQKQGFGTLEDEITLKAYRLMNIYGEVTPEVVAFDENEKGEERIFALLDVIDLAVGGDQASRKDEKEMENDRPIAGAHNYYRHASTRLSLLKALGVIDSDGSLDASHIIDYDGLADWFLNRKEEMAMIGFHVSEYGVKNIGNLVGKFLKTVGLKLNTKKETVEGKRVRVPRLCKKRIEFIQETALWSRNSTTEEV